MRTFTRNLDISKDVYIPFLPSEHGHGYTATIRADLAKKDFPSWYCHLQGKIDGDKLDLSDHDVKRVVARLREENGVKIVFTPKEKELILVWAGSIYYDLTNGFYISENQDDVVSYVNNNKLTVQNENTFFFKDRFWYNQ